MVDILPHAGPGVCFPSCSLYAACLLAHRPSERQGPEERGAWGMPSCATVGAEALRGGAQGLAVESV